MKVAGVGVEHELCDGVRVLARLALTTSRVCDETGLSLVQYRLLCFIAEEPQRAGKLAERLAVSRPTLTAATRALEERGLVLREPVPGDGRGIQLRLTPTGEAAQREAEAHIARHLLGLADQETILALLRQLVTLSGPLDRELRRMAREYDLQGAGA